MVDTFSGAVLIFPLEMVMYVTRTLAQAMANAMAEPVRVMTCTQESSVNSKMNVQLLMTVTIVEHVLTLLMAPPFQLSMLASSASAMLDILATNARKSLF